MIDLIEIGRQIALSRKLARLTQQDLAARSRTSRATIAALEQGTAGELGFKKIARILAALNLELKIVPASGRRPTLDELLETES